MHLKTRTTFLSILTTFALFASFSFYLSRLLSPGDLLRSLSPATHITYNLPRSTSTIITSEQKQQQHQQQDYQTQKELSRPRNAGVNFPLISRPDAILLPDWEVFVVLPLGASPSSYCGTTDGNQCFCVYPNNETSPARPTGILPFSNRTAFTCGLPTRTRRTLPFPQPILAQSRIGIPRGPGWEPPPVLSRWNFLAYESLSTDEDVILFVKGVNNRQGVNRAPEEFRCVFGDVVNDDYNSVIRTPVTSSNQEVFRCHHPNVASIRHLFSHDRNKKIKISLELVQEKKIAPSVTYYDHALEQKSKIAGNHKKALLCACTMVYNVAKFLREWIVYHSRIGIEKFILYDNGSDDDLEKVVKKLLEEEGEGFDVATIWWPWPKTQEAGFSHCATYARDACTWMTYVDVDEFIFSPSWLNASHPSPHMLTSLIPITTPSSSSPETVIGQIWMLCYEFGPSKQRVHPVKGVTQGYTCRRREEQRHKSMVLLEAVDTSLSNAIHHFELRRGYTVKRLREEEGVVNHYKYQAWPEFKKKFRRRVSAYVVDWRQELNPKSNDRTPGLGFEAVEPEGWAEMFCEVRDERLKVTTRRWFGVRSGNGYKMAWQDD